MTDSTTPQDSAAMSPASDGSVLALAISFHEAYERLAPLFGYQTRPETRNFDPQSNNGRLMVAVCREIIEQNARIERLAILRLADQDATLSAQGGNVTVTMDATLTDAEREAIGNVLHHIATRADHLQREAHDLRGLLERLK